MHCPHTASQLCSRGSQQPRPLPRCRQHAGEAGRRLPAGACSASGGGKPGGWFGFLTGKGAAGGSTVPQQEAASPSLLSGGGGQPELELPPYSVIRRTKDYTLRLYDVYPVVVMPYQRREEGYAALGSFFDGANADGTRFSYTQPVVMTYRADGSKTMYMHVGSRRDKPGTAAGSAATLPLPTDPAVSLGVSGGELVAVLQFDGFITPQTAGTARAQLKSALARDGVQLAEEDAAGRFRVGQFGAVYSIMGRLNEMMLRVKA